MPAIRSMRLASLFALGAALGLGAAGCERRADQPEPSAAIDPARGPRLLEGLGDHHHPITTSAPEAQRWFDQGLILVFGFNHEAAVEAFREASRVDPGCAMCAWGVALALGPNINLPMGPEAGRDAWQALQQALALRSNASPHEQALIDALSVRYAADPPEDRTALDVAYAEAMGRVHDAWPQDVDTAVLLAESLMDLTPWDYWDDDARPREHTLEVLELLEWAMAREPTHVGANHYYIHAVEEYYPEKAEAAADRLAPLAPTAGHLVHMPSHIYWRLGRYEDALEINRNASAADEQFFSWCQPGAFYRAAYYPHNIHFLWSAAAAEGQSELALASARRLEAATRESLAEFDFLEEFQAIPVLTLVRFGRWDAVLGAPRPDEAHRYLVGVWHYARGIALVRTGDAAGAAAELAALQTVVQEEATRQLMLAGASASASALLSIGAAQLEGELAAGQGELDVSVAALERAASLQDALVYTEPPPWFFPTRQALGAVLLEADRPAEAEAVYLQDLSQHPRNGWSLFGLAKSLRAQGKDGQAEAAEQGFRHAWARADVELASSRF